MAVAGLLLMAASAAVSIIGQQQSAKAEQANAEFQGKQLEQQAGQTRATAQRQGLEDQRQARLANSRIQALAGGGGGDESVMDLTGKIAGEGEYAALTSMYQGEEGALGREGQAASLRFQGQAARTAANYKSASTILSTGSSMFGKYGGGGFGASDGYAEGVGSAYNGRRRGL